MLIDDDPDFAESLEDVLKGQGMETRVALDAGSALAFLSEFAPDVCLVDLRLGNAPGIELIPAIRERSPLTLSVVLTAYADTETAIAALHAGAYDYLRKPVEIRELLVTLDRCAERLELIRAREKAERDLAARNEELRKINARLRGIVNTAGRLTACRSRRELDRRLLAEFARHMGADGGSLLLRHGDTLQLAHTLDPEHVPGSLPGRPAAHSVLARVLERGEPLLVEDISKEQGLQGNGWSGYRDGSLLAVPLVLSEEGVVGIITLHNKQSPPFTSQDKDLGRILMSLSAEVIRGLRALEAMEAQERYFREVVENAPNLIAVVAPDGVIRYISPFAGKMLGYEAGHAVGKNVFAYMEPSQARHMRDLVRSGRLSQSETYLLSIRSKQGSGAYRTVEVSMRDLSRDSVVGGIVVNGRDVTGHMEMLEALRASEAQYRTLFESTMDAIVLEQNGSLLDCNQAAQAIFGAEREVLLGRAIHQLSAAAAGSEVERVLLRHIERAGAGRSQLFEHVFRRIGGTEFEAEVSLVKVNLGIGPCLQWMIRDITERKTAQRNLIQAAKLVSLGTLTSGVAHEINNPNNFIRLNVQNVQDLWCEIIGRLPEVRRQGPVKGLPFPSALQAVGESLQGIEEGSKRIEKLVNGLKDFSRPEQNLPREEVALADVVESSLAIMGNLLREATERLLVDVSPDLPRFLGSYHQIEQVVMNLLSNAAQALDNRQQAIRIHGRADQTDRFVELSVSDEGRGIPEADLSRATDPFFTTKREQGGTGLGLAVSHSIVENHGGRLTLASRPGEGTTATVRLPAVAAKE